MPTSDDIAKQYAIDIKTAARSDAANRTIRLSEGFQKREGVRTSALVRAAKQIDRDLKTKWTMGPERRPLNEAERNDILRRLSESLNVARETITWLVRSASNDQIMDLVDHWDSILHQLGD